MKCQKCGQEFPNKKGRYCGTCNWNSPGFQYGSKSGAKKEFSMTVMEMEELATYKAALKVASETLIAISDLGERYGYGRCECGKCYACLAHKTLKQLHRMGVKL